MQAAGGIDDDGIVPHRARLFDGLLRRFNGVLRAFFEHRHARFAAHHLQLVDGGGAVDVARDQKRLFSLFFEQERQLAAQRGFARALQTAHHDDRGRAVCHFQFGVGGAHQRDEFVVDDFNDLLGGVEAFEDLLPHRLFGNIGNEFFGDENVDVRLQKRHAHLAHRALDFQFGQTAVLGEFGKNVIESVGQRGKQCHAAPPYWLLFGLRLFADLQDR